MSKYLTTMLALLLLAGCGVEVAGTAATGAAAKAKEAEEAKKTMEKYQQDLNAAQQAQLKGVDEAEKAAAEK